MRGVVDRQTERELAEALDQCIDMLHRGATVEDCLRQFPSFREQLTPLLAVTEEVWRATHLRPSEGFRRAAKARLLATALQRQAAPAHGQTVGWRWWSLRIAAAAAALTLVAMPAIGASAESLPGTPLFPLKRAVEEARLLLAAGPDAQMQARLDIARERLRELERLRARGQESDEAVRGLALALGRLEEHLRARSDDQPLPPGLVAQIEELSERLGVQGEGEPVQPQPRGQAVRQLAAQARELRDLAHSRPQPPALGASDHGNQGRGRRGDRQEAPAAVATATPRPAPTATAIPPGTAGQGQSRHGEGGSQGRDQHEDRPPREGGRAAEEPRGQGGRPDELPRSQPDQRVPLREPPGRSEGQGGRDEQMEENRPAPAAPASDDRRQGPGPGMVPSGPGRGAGPPPGGPPPLRGRDQGIDTRDEPSGPSGGSGASRPGREELPAPLAGTAEQRDGGRVRDQGQRGRDPERR
jgi:hypothetical protein